jgi:hypothetical protein
MMASADQRFTEANDGLNRLIEIAGENADNPRLNETEAFMVTLHILQRVMDEGSKSAQGVDDRTRARPLWRRYLMGLLGVPERGDANTAKMLGILAAASLRLHKAGAQQ